MKCVCCWKPAERKRDGNPFCAKCLDEIEVLEKLGPMTHEERLEREGQELEWQGEIAGTIVKKYRWKKRA